MFYPLSLFIAWRYSRSKQANSFISFITFFSVAGITLGVLALITVISVMNGFESELKRRVLGVVPHVVVKKLDTQLPFEQLKSELEALPEVAVVTPFRQSEGMVQSAQDMRAVQIQGVEPSLEAEHSIVSSNIIAGSYQSLIQGTYHVLIGRQLAYRLGVNVGQKIRIMIAERSVYSPMGRMPIQRKFLISGIFDAGSDVDGNVALINIHDLNRMLRESRGEITGARVYLHDAFVLNQTLSALQGYQPEFTVTDWRTSQGKLFSAVKMEKNMMWLMLCLIVAVAAFNIVSALVMVVTDKQGEIATLKTLGLNERSLVSVFILQGVYKGCLGAVLGTASGLLLAFNLNTILSTLGIGIFAIPGSGINGLPVDVQSAQVITIAVGAVVMSLLATLYPAIRAARTQPAEVLRYE